MMKKLIIGIYILDGVQKMDDTKKKFKISLTTQILIATIAGIVFGAIGSKSGVHRKYFPETDPDVRSITCNDSCCWCSRKR